MYRDRVASPARGKLFYRTLLENSFEGIAIVNAEGVITFQNRAAAQILGAKEGALIGTSALDLIHPDDVASAMGSLAKLNANEGVLLPDEVRMKRRDDGRYVYLETRAVNLAENPEVRGIVVNFRDVSEQRAAMRALQASERRLELAMGASDLASWDWDLETNRMVFDGRLAKLLDLDPEELGSTREALIARVHDDDRPAVVDALQGHMEGHLEHFEVEHRLRAKDRSYRWVSVRGPL